MWNNSNKPPEINKIVLVKYKDYVTIGYIDEYSKWTVLIDMNYSEPTEYGYNVDIWTELPQLP